MYYTFMIINPSSLRQKIHHAQDELQELHRALLAGAPMLGYSLIRRTTQCRKGDCKCTRGKPHGPFLYLSARIRGKTAYRYLRQADGTAIAPLCAEYKNFQRRLRKLRSQQAAILIAYARLRGSLIRLGEIQWKKQQAL